MAQVFWRLSHGCVLTGLAESDEKVMEPLEAQYGPMEPWVRMNRATGVSIHVLLGGTRVNDITWTWYSQCLIQDRVLRMFREQGFTGFDVHPVEAKWKKNRREGSPDIPTLWELIPLGWGGMAPEESGIHRVPGPPDAPESLCYSDLVDPSKLVDEKQWDGSDFFIFWPMPTYINVTDRVARFIRDNKLRTAVLERLDRLQVHTDDGLATGYTPGPLRWYFPEPRAREIGEPLGIY